MVGKGTPKYSEEICPQCRFLHHKFLHDLTWARTWATAVGSRRQTAWATARPKCKIFSDLYEKLSTKYTTGPLINFFKTTKIFCFVII
jgi:hypothetical protein